MIRGYLGMTRDVGDRLKDVLAVDGECRWRSPPKVIFSFCSHRRDAARARKAAEELKTGRPHVVDERERPFARLATGLRR